MFLVPPGLYKAIQILSALFSFLAGSVLIVLLQPNITYGVKKLLHILEPDDPEPKKQPRRLWVVFGVSVLVGLVGFALFEKAETDIMTAGPTPEVRATATMVAFELLTLDTPVKVGEYANVVVRTAPHSTCFLSYTTPGGTQSTASGLGPKTADSQGLCSWMWHIGSRTTPGPGEVSVLANGVTKTYPIEITR